MSREGESMTGTLITLGVIGAAAYLAWQWLQSACGAGGSMTGNWMCGALGVNPAAAATTSTTGAVPGSTGVISATITAQTPTSVQITVKGPANSPVLESGPGPATVIGTTDATGTFVTPVVPLSNSSYTVTLSISGAGSTTVAIPAASSSTLGVTNTSGSSSSAPLTPPASAGSAGSPTSVITGTLQQLASQNAFFVQQDGEGDAYQWAALWAQTGQPSFNVNSIFYPNGIAAASGSGAGFSSGNLPLISVSQFLSALSSAGISPSGMSGINRIPAAMIHLGRVM